MKPEKPSGLSGCIGGALGVVLGGGIGIIVGAIVAFGAINAGYLGEPGYVGEKRGHMDIWALLIAVSTISIGGGALGAVLVGVLGAVLGGRAGSRNVEAAEPEETSVSIDGKSQTE